MKYMGSFSVRRALTAHTSSLNWQQLTCQSCSIGLSCITLTIASVPEGPTISVQYLALYRAYRLRVCKTIRDSGLGVEVCMANSPAGSAETAAADLVILAGWLPLPGSQNQSAVPGGSCIPWAMARQGGVGWDGLRKGPGVGEGVGPHLMGPAINS